MTTNITVELMGGLGNQLFQIFTLIATSIDCKIPFYFKNVKSPKIGWRKIFYWSNFLHKLQIFIKDLQPYHKMYQEETSKQFSPIVINNNINKNIQLFGYFQSYKYFNNHKKIICDLIDLENQKLTLKHKYEVDFFIDCVSLHFRIGDYLDLQAYHPVLKIDYYINALKNLVDNTKKDNWKVLYFYEKPDEELVKNYIVKLKNIFSNMKFVNVNHELQDWEQMLSMSLCKHNIIANSSFSWWGAYMNDNDNIVYYPNVWFGEKKHISNIEDFNRDMFLPHWKIINVKNN